MNPLLNEQLGEMAKTMTAEQRDQFTAQVQQRIASSGMKLTPEAIDGAFSLLGMVATGRMSVPGLSAQLVRSLKSGGGRKLTAALAQEATPERRAERSAQLSHLAESTAPMREASVHRITSALNKAGESVGGRSDLGDAARVRGSAFAKAASVFGSQAKARASVALENTAESRAAALATASVAVSRANEAVGGANSASSTLRRHVGTVGPGGSQVAAMTGLVGKAGKTVGSAGAAVDLAGAVLDSLDEVLRPRGQPRVDRPEDI